MAVFSKENLPEDELKEEFICSAAGPGGQHVNKTATAVRLAFHAAESKILNERTRNRLYALAGTRAAVGFVTVFVKDSRSLAMNRDLARERLAALIAQAMTEPRKRKKTKPTKASKERRLKSKSIRSRVKSSRSGRYDCD